MPQQGLHMETSAPAASCLPGQPLPPSTFAVVAHGQAEQGTAPTPSLDISDTKLPAHGAPHPLKDSRDGSNSVMCLRASC